MLKWWLGSPCTPQARRNMGLFQAGASTQVGLDLQPRSAAESRAIDLQILHHPLHIVAGLGERDQFDPVDGVDLGIPRIAIALDPFFYAAASGIVGGKCHDVGAAIGEVCLAPASPRTQTASFTGSNFHRCRRLSGSPIAAAQLATAKTRNRSS